MHRDWQHCLRALTAFIQYLLWCKQYNKWRFSPPQGSLIPKPTYLHSSATVPKTNVVCPKCPNSSTTSRPQSQGTRRNHSNLTPKANIRYGIIDRLWISWPSLSDPWSRLKIYWCAVLIRSWLRSPRRNCTTTKNIKRLGKSNLRIWVSDAYRFNMHDYIQRPHNIDFI